MAKKKKNDDRESSGLKSQTKHGIVAIVFFVLALFFLMSKFNMAGVAGDFVSEKLNLLLGIGDILLPALFILLGTSFIKSQTPDIGWRSMISAVMFLLSSLGIIDIASGVNAEGVSRHAGGLFGEILSTPLAALFDIYASIIFLGALLIISILVIFNEELELAVFFTKVWNMIRKVLGIREKDVEEELPEDKGETQPPESPLSRRQEQEEDASPDRERKEGLDKRKKSEQEDEEIEFKKLKPRTYNLSTNYTPPPLSLLEEDQGKPNTGDIKANANIIKRTLANFGIEVEMDEITIGPTVTRYALKPAEGVKLSRIIALQNDLALALAAHPIRIEAPIPGRSLGGIEIPNKIASLVRLKNLLEIEAFNEAPSSLTFALGRDVTGSPVYADLGRMPHLLIAGSTGSGKSVCIHDIIISFLYRNSPKVLKFIFIDPKRVELSVYNGIPHLLSPVITEGRKAINALRWAVGEMERRYEKLEQVGARDIGSYNSKINGKNPQDGRLPYIVIMIDELADLMAAFPREVEGSIVRLAQMARAVGIHLIVSPQRPSVEVITGLIKANITSRIAFQVASQIDSRTILDMAGAEKLLGDGDMLYLAGDIAKPRRIQGAFVSEQEVKKVTEWLASHAEELTDGHDIFSPKEGQSGENIFDAASPDGDVDDELYEEARRIAIEAGKVSASYLQRRLLVGYARAARLLDMMEERGVIGPADGAKPREVLVKKP